MYLLLLASVTPPPSVLSLFVFASSFDIVLCLSAFLVLTLFLCSRQLTSCLAFVYLAYDLCLFVDHDVCLALLNLVFFTLCISVPPSPSLLTSLTITPTSRRVQLHSLYPCSVTIGLYHWPEGQGPFPPSSGSLTPSGLMITSSTPNSIPWPHVTTQSLDKWNIILFYILKSPSYTPKY